MYLYPRIIHVNCILCKFIYVWMYTYIVFMYNVYVNKGHTVFLGWMRFDRSIWKKAFQPENLLSLPNCLYRKLESLKINSLKKNKI